jgi:hypothetical protein
MVYRLPLLCDFMIYFFVVPLHRDFNHMILYFKVSQVMAHLYNLT